VCVGVCVCVCVCVVVSYRDELFISQNVMVRLFT